ncbi:unnamed protein product [Amoebophrya sp. A120]|nr:unnamed protein product [Amoebophrya sp. A120]|eukprot:GSA120T00019553001.1
MIEHAERLRAYLMEISVEDARYCLIAIVLTQWLLSSTVSMLNVGNLKRPLDPLIPKLYGPSVLEKYEKSKAYIMEKNTFGEIHGAWGQFIAFALWFGKGYPMLDQALKAYFKDSDLSPATLGTIYLLVLMYATSILDLPWGWYSNFVLEEKYGFNRMTLMTWLKDTLKGWALTLVLGGGFMYVFLLILTNFAVEQYWWLLASFMMAFQLIMLVLQPWIMKLFLEFIPIEGGLAFVTRGKADKFMKNRYFYPSASGEENVFETRDSQYKGQAKGSCLQLRQIDSKWVICEKDNNETVHATAASSSSSMPQDVSSWDYKCTEKKDDKAASDNATDSLLAEKSSEGEESSATKRAANNDEEESKPLWVKKIDMGDLRSRLESMANEHKFKFQAVYIIDGSTRSEHSNAFFMGFGWFRKICLYDTLLKNLSVDSVCGIMGHEMGHCVMLHIPKNVVFAAVQSFFMLYCIAQFLYNKTLHAAFFVDVSDPANITPWIGLIIVQNLLTPLFFFLGLLSNYRTRKYEYEADQFAVESFEKNYAQDLITGLKGLLMENKSHLNPHWLYVMLNHSHPTLTQRVRWIQSLSTKREGKDIIRLDA